MKKLLNILSLLTLTSLTSLSTIACSQQNNTFKIPFAQQENDIVQAINATQNKQLKTNFSPLTVNDILANPIITNSSLNSKHEVKFTYDIKIKQTANTFLNNHFTYRIPKVSGNFILNLDNKKINNNNINSIIYLVGNYQNYINNIDSILTGDTDDFTIVMNSSAWNTFIRWISHDTHWNKYDGADAWLHYFNLYNANITLTNDQWNLILKQLKILDMPEGYVVCLHVIKFSDKNFPVIYNNLTKKDEYNMPFPSKQPLLPLFAFNSIKDWEDGSVLTTNNKFIGLNKDLLKELTDIYTDCNCQNYKSQNWNITKISQLLQTNHFCNTNLDLKTIATCLVNNWNINLVNNFLASNHEYFLMQYDANNNYIKNNWNM